MPEGWREIVSGVAVVLTFAAFAPYIVSILRGRTKPHVFSWVIWSAVTLPVFFAQLAAEGGAGAWPTGVSGLITLSVAVATDLFGFGPTFRKSYENPYGEDLWLYGLAIVRNAMVIAALERLSLTTVLFPAAVAISCAIFLAMVFWRRTAVPRVGDARG